MNFMKQIGVSIFLYVWVILLFSCNSKENKGEIAVNEEEKVKIDGNRGAEMMKNLCFSCHNPVTLGGVRVAPSMYEVRDVYFEKNSEEVSFVSMFVKNATNPSMENALMKEDIGKYGLMSNMGYDDETIEEIAKYLYKQKIDSISKDK